MAFSVNLMVEFKPTSARCSSACDAYVSIKATLASVYARRVNKKIIKKKIRPDLKFLNSSLIKYDVLDSD